MKLKKIVTALTLISASALGFAAETKPIKIGFITDGSSLYSDIDGIGGKEAMEMAIADFGGSVLGRKVEVLYADHQNKADIAAGKAREWIDLEGVNVIFGGTNSGTALATSKVTAEKKRIYINNGAGTSALTNEQCTPYTIHYTYDTIALANVTGKAMLEKGNKNWFFLTADYAFGEQLQKDASKVVNDNGGKVLGAVKHPLNASDFSSFLLQAQNSKAQVLGMANAGGDTINSVKAANEFGINKTMKLAGLLVFITDVHSIGIKNASGLLATEAWYWDLNDETRAFAGRFIQKMKRMPTSVHAGDYSSMLTYLKAVKAAGTDNPDKVMAELQKMKINDLFTKGGYIRKDGTMMHDMYLFEVKKPEEVTKPWDYYRIVKKLPGEQAFNTLAESKCSLIK
ncbi:branched-chain amino acid ABC transporter substrate-binding protein [Polynucleobacter sp. SHI8]|uniref:ABC transporter substrate-binding protein n=1 Tax=unclassified Polynucleobacter TaxID=2640945 RepID=UPI00249017EE|nr:MULTISPECIES: ABC transporter substrate-binding protein [unclassified Polynucleobacter]BDW09927.1 branched-chain amino acid ABC transporter substrate-binding protein [Polynucleobacter sp. SHI2]BDW12373.1 branched-chain amino acid ABC transporter substrate-binding protein [Polynucleobacter sp. SHI8]